ncbi:MAG: hypothetical protein ACLQVM_21380 [Terriglobia bacterium]
MENHHGKSKVVVGGISISPAEITPLQLGRREIRLPDGASKNTASASLRHLHRVAIHKSHKSAIGHKEVALVEIAYDITAGVDGIHNARDVRRRPDQITPGESGGHSLPILRIVKLKHGSIRGEVHVMHEKSSAASAARLEQKGLRPAD